MKRERRRSVTGLGFFLAVALWAQGALATTLEPVTFGEQASRAETIFRGRVQGIESAWEGIGEERSIFSRIRFEVLAVYKGEAPSPYELRMVGGEIGGLKLAVDGTPQFSPGEEWVLFVSGNGTAACPLAGWKEGALRVGRDEASGAAEVVLSDPLRARVEAGDKRALGLGDFESLLDRTLREAGEP